MNDAWDKVERAIKRRTQRESKDATKMICTNCGKATEGVMIVSTTSDPKKRNQCMECVEPDEIDVVNL